MPRYAMVNDEKGFVANLVLWSGSEEEWRPPEGHTMVLVDDVFCGPGFTYENGQFVPPPQGDIGLAMQRTLDEQAAAKAATEAATAPEEFTGIPAEEPAAP